MKYIQINGDTGTISVVGALDPEFYGWVYEVPSDFSLIITLKSMEGVSYIHELLDKPIAQLVKQY